MEISTIRSQLSRNPSDTHSTQISALEEKLNRADRAASSATRELADVKKNLERASEKAVKEGSERTSAETRIRSLARGAEESRKAAEESVKRVEVLEKKLAALTGMHKESDTRRQAGERERERLEKEAGATRRRLAELENENLKIREERDRLKKKEAGAGAVDDEGIDELENDERSRLETNVRTLEAEVYDLRRGVWREKRRELGEGDEGFDEIDLTGTAGTPHPRRQSNPRGSSFSDVLSSGINAFTRGGDGGLDEEEEEFDEEGFRAAQEEEARRRVERVREVKRGLREWEGWRMDLVDVRVGGGGMGEIFDV